MSQSDYYSKNSDGLKDKVSDATDAVQQASVDAYETVRDTAQEQPFISGMLVGGSSGLRLAPSGSLNCNDLCPPMRWIAFTTTLTRQCVI